MPNHVMETGARTGKTVCQCGSSIPVACCRNREMADAHRHLAEVFAAECDCQRPPAVEVEVPYL